jgi:hypothetical protein
MTVWSGFYDHILPEVNGVLPASVDFVLRQICIDFCQETGVHTSEVTPINVVALTAEYTLTSTVTGTEPYQVKAAWFDGTPLDLAPIDTLNAAPDYWPNVTATTSTAFTQKQPDKIILYPTPDTAVTAGLRVELILRPTQSSTGLTDWIATRYMRELACGVKGRLMAQSDKPWSRPDQAAYYLGLYEAAKTRATIDVNRSFMRSTLSVRPRPAVR